MKHRLVPIFLAACAIILSGCLMAGQYRIVSNIDTLAGDRRFKPDLFEEMDTHALQALPSAAKSFDTLAAYLSKTGWNELQKTRAIWRWITSNIAYDTARKNYTAGETLRDRQGTCQGYSELFIELALRAGIMAIEITGYGRGADYSPGGRVTNNHAWNGVLIDGRWYLLDCTYGAGHVREDRFIREYREHYFLTPPGEFIYSNLPELRQWQLIAPKITKRDFERLPFYRHGYFRYGLRQLDDNRSCVILCAGELRLSFAAPPGVMITANLRDESGKTLHNPVIMRKNNIIEITASFLTPGNYRLIGWISPVDRPRDYSWAFTYLVQSR